MAVHVRRLLRMPVGGARLRRQQVRRPASKPGLGRASSPTSRASKVRFPAPPYGAKACSTLALRGTETNPGDLFERPASSHDIARALREERRPRGLLRGARRRTRASAGPARTSRSRPLGATLYRAMKAAEIPRVEVRDLHRGARPALHHAAELRPPPRVGSARRAVCCWPATPPSAAPSCTRWPRRSRRWHSTTSTPLSRVVGSRNWITPAAEMEELYFPASELDPRRHPRAHPAAAGASAHDGADRA